MPRLRSTALRRDELEPVGGFEIAEGVVAGDELPAVGGNLGDHVAHLALERVELGEVGRGIGLVGDFAGGIGGDQRIADIGDVDFRVGHRLPGVRVGLPVVVVVSAPAGALARLDALGRNDDRRLGAGGLDQPLDPTLEAEPVDEHELGVGHALGVGRRRRIDMGVAVGADQRPTSTRSPPTFLTRSPRIEKLAMTLSLSLGWSCAPPARRRRPRARTADAMAASRLVSIASSSRLEVAAGKGCRTRAADAAEQQRDT